MFSYWEQKNFLNYDLIVVGSGFTGLSTAIHFKKKQPKSKVLILDRGIFPTGASTKNAGFACFGSLTEILDDFWQMTPKEVTDLIEMRYKGLCQIRKKFGDKALRYQDSHGFELLDEESLAAVDQLGEVNRMLKGIFKKEVFAVIKKPERFGFSEQVKIIVENRFEGELDPAAYLTALWEEASALGVRILTGVNVTDVDVNEGIVLARGSFGEKIAFSAGKVAICTNAFTKALVPELDLESGRGLILLSKPVEGGLPWSGSFHVDKGYVYFRQVDGRLLLGGARNVDFEGERTPDFGSNPKIKAHLQKLASEVICPGRELNWESEWSGIMAFGPKKAPLIQAVGARTAVGVRLGGMGVAIGWQVGKELSRLLSKM